MKDYIMLLVREGLNELDDFDPFAHSGYEEPDEISKEPICVLGMSKGNAKLDWPYMSLPAGYTCPQATICKNFAARRQFVTQDLFTIVGQMTGLSANANL